MLKNVSAFVLMMLCSAFLAGSIHAQELEEFYEVPLKYFSFSLLNERTCPLQLSNPRVLVSKTGSFQHFYDITNNSNSSVKRFVAEEFDAFVNPSYGGMPTFSANDESTFVPNNTVSTMWDEAKIKISPMPLHLVTKFKLSEQEPRIWVVLVTKVELYDGTIYDATDRRENIKQFINKIQEESWRLVDEELDPIPYTRKLRQLQEFLPTALDAKPRGVEADKR